MPDSERKHFITKHGLDAFEALHNFVWRTDRGPKDMPKPFRHVQIGDRWIGFAYTSSDRRERALSLVTGFYECTKPAIYRDIPPPGIGVSAGVEKAWMIEGEVNGVHHDGAGGGVSGDAGEAAYGTGADSAIEKESLRVRRTTGITKNRMA